MKKKSKPAFVKQIGIVIANDYPIVREGLNALVAFQKDMQVVSEAANGLQAVEMFSCTASTYCRQIPACR